MSASSSSSSGRGGVSSQKKTRRKRSNISGEILQCLEKFYESKPHPDSHERRQLAMELGETENLVRIWFQNRRAKRRRVRNQLLQEESGLIMSKCAQNSLEGNEEDDDKNNNGHQNDDSDLQSQKESLSCEESPSKTTIILAPSSSSSHGGTTTKRKKLSAFSSCNEAKNTNYCSSLFSSPSPSSSYHLHQKMGQEIPSERSKINIRHHHNHHSSLPQPNSSSCQSSSSMGEMPLMLDVHLYPRILSRIIGMVAAGESILKESDADFYESLNDAHFGILLKDNKKLLYNKVYGLHVVDSM